MKRLLAVLLVLIMVFSLAACGAKTDDGNTDADSNVKTDTDADKNNKTDNDSSNADTTGTAGYPNANADGSINLDTIAHYDRSYDYSKNERFKMCYMAFNADVLYQQAADSYQAWCDKFNLEWMGFVSASNDNEMFLTNLQTYLDQGVDIIVMDPDITIYPKIGEILSNYPDVAWMSMMGQPRDYVATDELPYGQLLKPFAGFDYYQGGVVCAEDLIAWKEATYPDVPWSDFGIAAYTLSTSPPLFQRENGCHDTFMKIDGVSESQYFAVDVASNGLSMQGAMDAFAPVVATNSNFKYWLVFGLIDDVAMGAATVLENANLTETSCVNAIGGAGLQTQLDAGQSTAFRSCYSLPTILYAEPIMGACYSWKMGWATPDTLWPSWVRASDHGGEGHSYATIMLPSYFITADNYKEFFSWTDLYTGIDFYKYGVDVAIDAYSPFLDVPVGYRDS